MGRDREKIVLPWGQPEPLAAHGCGVSQLSIPGRAGGGRSWESCQEDGGRLRLSSPCPRTGCCLVSFFGVFAFHFKCNSHLAPGEQAVNAEGPTELVQGCSPHLLLPPNKALPTGQRRQAVTVPQRAACPLLAPFGGCTKPGRGGEDGDGEAFCCSSEPDWEGTVGKMSPHQLGCCKGAPVPGELGLGESGSAGLDSSGASPG